MTEIDVAVVEALIAEQFPQWAALPVSPVAAQGWDNRTFRLGDELSVRLPSAAVYAAAVLSAVIDFGCCAIGDPACDLALAWTYFSGPARRAFWESLDLDVDTWRRARGWVLWKALVTIAGMSTPDATGVHERHLAEALEAPTP